MSKVKNYDSIRVRADTYKQLQVVAIIRHEMVKELFDEVMNDYTSGVTVGERVKYVETYDDRPGVTLMIKKCTTPLLKPMGDKMKMTYVDTVEMVWRWYVTEKLNSKERKIVKLI